MRAAKWVGIALAALLLLAVMLVLVVTLVVDPNRFKGRIERLVSETSGQPFVIRGDLDIAWFPWLALRMGEAQLGAPLVQWRSASFGAKLIPLLKGQLIVSRVRLEGLRLHLERGADGRSNWDSLLEQDRDAGSRSGASPEIAGLEIREGELQYADGASGTRVSLSDWQLDVGAWKQGEPFSLSTRFKLRYGDASNPFVPVDAEFPRIVLKQGPLAVSIPGMSLRIANASLRGGASLEASPHSRGQGAFVLETSSLRELLGSLAIGGPRPRDTDTLKAVSFDTQWALIDGALALKPIRLRLDDTRFEGEAVRPAGDDSILRFELRGDRIALDRYVELEDTSTEPFELPVAALRELRVAGVLSFAEARMAGATIKNARIRLETPAPQGAPSATP